MTAQSWDAIVIGSGVGGLSCAAALAKCGRRVLVLESHYVAGGLTHTFERNGFRWDVGLHYLGDFGPRGAGGKLLRWLGDGRLSMAAVGEVYDILHFPGGFEFACAAPAATHVSNLKRSFPRCGAQIDAWFAALRAAELGARTAFARRAMPPALGCLYGLWKQRELARWCARTTDEVLREIVDDEKLRAVLCAQWGRYGGRPAEASFALHATVCAHFANGAYYPAGGAGMLARTLIPAIEAAGGAVRISMPVDQLLIEDGAVAGVVTANGESFRAGAVFSDAGAHNTVALLLQEMEDSAWTREVLSLRRNVAHLCLYLGFEGDIRAAGATTSNHWFYETWNPGEAIWQDPVESAGAPMLFVSFASLKDPAWQAGDSLRHTAEAIAWVNWDAFAQWADSRHGARPQAYEELKAAIERKLLDQFRRYFPRLGSLIAYHELSTPLSTVAFTRHPEGAFYGLEVTPRRMMSRALDARTPVRGLYLCGQDVVSPGIMGAMTGGVLAAAALEPRILRRF